MITELTREQIEQMPVYTEKWTQIGRCTDPANRPVAEDGVYMAYAAAGLPPPATLLWVRSPWEALQTTWKLGGEALGASVKNALWLNIKRRVIDALSANVVARLGDADWVDHTAALSSAIYARLSRDLQGNTWSQGTDCCHGQHDSGWLAYPAFVRDVGNRPDLVAPLEGYLRIAQNAGWFLPYAKLCILCERQSNLHLDLNGQLHSRSGMALAFPDGWGVYCWHGVCVPEYVVMQPERITREQINAEPNERVREVMLDRMVK
jgi:hypothetical protein